MPSETAGSGNVGNTIKMHTEEIPPAAKKGKKQRLNKVRIGTFFVYVLYFCFIVHMKTVVIKKKKMTDMKYILNISRGAFY